MTPQEMADWLTYRLGDQRPADEATLREILAWLRRQPTDAQKMQALRKAGVARLYGCNAIWHQSVGMRVSYAVTAASAARKAMRLLGLPTGDDTP